MIEKEIRKVDKDGNEDVTTISYKIKFIDSAGFMASSLSNLVDDLAEGIKNIKGIKKGIKKYCNKKYSNKIDKELRKQSKNTFNFSNNVSINLFCC